ncbi:hypothetical protein [Shewanella indica]
MTINHFSTEKEEFFDFLLDNGADTLAEALIEGKTPLLPLAEKNRLMQLAGSFRGEKRNRLAKYPSEYFALVTTSGWGRGGDASPLSPISQ